MNRKLVVFPLSELPEMVRGYEEIKLRSVERFRERAAELRAAIAG